MRTLVSASSTWSYGRSAPVPRSSGVRGGRRIEVPHHQHWNAGVLIGDLGHRRRQLGAHELFVVCLFGAETPYKATMANSSKVHKEESTTRTTVGGVNDFGL